MDAQKKNSLREPGGGVVTDTVKIWIAVGLVGQAFFFSRFLIQWIVSEKTRRSVIPNVFWYLSILGGTLLLSYAIHRHDPVVILGQSVGLLVYLRNIWLVRKAEEID